MKPVASADEIARQLLLAPAMPESDFWRLAVEVVHADVGHLEQDLAAIREPARDQILDHLLLAIDGDAPSHQLAKVDVVQRACKGEIHAVVKHALAQHAL